METRTERTNHPQGFTETGIVIHEGREFSSGGAFLSDGYLIGYPDESGNLKTWNGEYICKIQIIGRRPAIFFGHRSWQGSTFYYYRATLPDGRRYHGSGFGSGMIARFRRSK